MNNKFGRDDRYRADLEQSPDRQFETSGNYREPREPYGETYTAPERRYDSVAGGWSRAMVCLRSE